MRTRQIIRRRRAGAALRGRGPARLPPVHRTRLRDLLGWVVGLAALTAGGVLLRLVTQPLAAQDGLLVVRMVAVRTSPLTALAHALSLLGRSPTVVVLAAIVDLAWIQAVRAPRRRPVVLVGVVSAVIVQNAVKALIERPRPPVVHLEHVTSSSFPSGHATEITALVVAVIMRLWPVGDRRDLRALTVVAGVALVVGVCLARIYLGVHYPTDVACGVVLGGGCAALAGRLGRPSGSSEPRGPARAPASAAVTLRDQAPR